jgi:hypothetical protein
VFFQNFCPCPPPPHSIMGTGDLSSDVKQLGPEFDNSSPSIVGIKNEWNYTSTPALYPRRVVKN